MQLEESRSLSAAAKVEKEKGVEEEKTFFKKGFHKV